MKRTGHSPKRILVANRGEIACRVMRSAREMGIETVAVYSHADRGALHVSMADQAAGLEGDRKAGGYLDIEQVVGAALGSGADAVHPGYGFLAENPAFAAAVEEAGLVFIGPAPATMEAMGDKIRARQLALENGVPVIPAAEARDLEATQKAAAELGYPLLVKAAAGGGGHGMRAVADGEELAAALRGTRREALSAFGDERVYLEKLIDRPRHIEVQLFGDGKGQALDLGERECSLQRRHQKIIEESPSAAVGEGLRRRIRQAALKLASATRYRGAGTVEFLVDGKGSFYFLEMNTRLQVEHAVTEMVSSVDMVRWQIELASGGVLPDRRPEARGHAIECRVYAEDPAAGFLPCGGRIARLELPAGAGLRVDSALVEGMDIAVEYDPLLAKVIAWAPDRPQAVARIRGAVAATSILGATTNLGFLDDMLASKDFAEACFDTTTVERSWNNWRPPSEGAGFEMAAAAAALLSLNAVPSRAGAGRTAAHRAEGPWQTLGPWRLGKGSP